MQALKFKIPSHLYPTRFPNVNYSKLKTRLRKSRLRISILCAATWNNFVANTEKELESSSLINAKVKAKLLDIKNAQLMQSLLCLVFFYHEFKLDT